MTELFDANGEPTHLARRHDPETSHAAAKAIDAREGTGRRLNPTSQKAGLLDAFVTADRPLADFEAAKIAGLYRAHVNYWHRVGDLLADGLLDDTGDTLVNPDTGKARRVCVINEAGRSEHRRLEAL